jgi:hypothetical protein
LDIEQAIEEFTAFETETSDDLDTAARRGVPDQLIWALSTGNSAITFI